MPKELLKAKEIRKLLAEPGKHSDGAGLYLFVRPSGNAYWVAQYRCAGRTCWATLGPYEFVDLEAARQKHSDLRRKVYEGIDPKVVADDLAEPVGKTFAEALSEYLDKKEAHWTASNVARERADHERTFARIPEFTALRVKAITPADKSMALARLTPSGRRKATSWIGAVIRFAETGEIIDRSRRDDDIEHHEAMPWADVPNFYAKLAGIDSDDARALRFTILTAARTDEVIGAKKGGEFQKPPATWAEITTVDDQPVWIVPPDRMKGGKVHRVPLSPAAFALLGKRRADDVPLFKASHQNGMLNTLKANGGNGYTVHGFRTSFTEYVAAETDFPDDLADRCIAHEKRGKVRRAYQRDDLLPKRRQVMDAWSDFVVRKTSAI